MKLLLSTLVASAAAAGQVGDKCSAWGVIPDFGAEASAVEHFVLNTVPFQSRADWGARVWNDAGNAGCNCVNKLTEIIPQADVNKITIHHTAFGDADADQIKRIQNGHMDGNGWCDVGYQLLIGTDGTVYQGRPFWNDAEDDSAFWPSANATLSDVFLGPKSLNDKPVKGGAWPYPGFVMGAHAPPNYGNIGVSLMGCYDAEECGKDGADPYTGPFSKDSPQYKSLVAVIAHLSENYKATLNVDSDVFGHRDLKNTTVCPGEVLELISNGDLAADAAALVQTANDAPSTKCMWTLLRDKLPSQMLGIKDRICERMAGDDCDGLPVICGPNIYKYNF
ncbi:MAG: hypothetical protein MHM6MM_003007 [Cercozoa sp. M6MM]